ncbi:MAG: hypothetical protein ACFFEN_08530 [Candidatus Thorarchaeota archaeon]
MPYCINCGAKIRWRFLLQKLCENCEIYARLLGSYEFIIQEKDEKKGYYESIKNKIKNILLTLVLGIVILIGGLFISYTIFHLLPEDPIVKYLVSTGMHSWGEAAYAEAARKLGFKYNSFFDVYYMPFHRYLKDLFTYNLGRSYVYVRRMPVKMILKETILYTSVVSLLPIIIGIVLGIIIGRSSSKNRDKRKGKPLLISCVIGIFLPILLIFMPMLVLTTVFITLQVRYFMVHKLYKKSIFTNTLFISRIFGFLLLFYILEDVGIYGAPFPYKTGGFGALLVESIYLSDHWLFRGCMLSLILILVIITLTSNFVLCFYKWIHKDVGTYKTPFNLQKELTKNS